MQAGRGLVLILAGVIAGMTLMPCNASGNSEPNENDIWAQGQDQRSSTRRIDLTEDEVNRLMSELKKTDPKKARDLEELQKKDPDKFQDELRRHAGEEYGKIIRERINAWRAKRQAEFLDWLKKTYPKEANDLAGLKNKEDYYWKKYEIIKNKYSRIYEEEKRNPELARVLKEDLQLQNRREELLGRLKRAKTNDDKKKIAAQLKEVVSRRFDLIVHRKQIAYERLIKRIEDLQKQLKASRNDIARWRDKDFKEKNLEERLKELTGSTKFQWD